MTANNQMMSFRDVVLYCLRHKEFVTEYNRLIGSSLLIDRRLPIEYQIDQVTGYQKEIEMTQQEELRQFIRFIMEYVWLPLVLTEGTNN